LTPSRTPACGGALTGAVGAALAEADMLMNYAGKMFVNPGSTQDPQSVDVRNPRLIQRGGRNVKGLPALLMRGAQAK
jgi:hypothetical protein